MSSGNHGPGMIRRMLSSATARGDPEKGYPPGEDGDTRPNSRPLTIMKSDPGALVPREDKLLIFRTLTGIDTVPVVSSSGHATRTAANIGIYTRVVRHERAAKKMHRVIKFLSSLCLGLQIIMGAAVTALGAAKGSYNGITGLGAVSTVTASIVAYIKGTGQPQKLKYVENRWKWIREHIEQRERELCLADCQLDVYHEVRIVEEMYGAVVAELDADKADRNSGGQGQQNGGAAPGTASGPGGFNGGGGGGGLSGTTAGLRPRSEILSYDGGREAPQRSEVLSYDGGREAPQKTTARPESTATFSCTCNKSAGETVAASGDRLPKE